MRRLGLIIFYMKVRAPIDRHANQEGTQNTQTPQA